MINSLELLQAAASANMISIVAKASHYDWMIECARKTGITVTVRTFAGQEIISVGHGLTTEERTERLEDALDQIARASTDRNSVLAAWDALGYLPKGDGFDLPSVLRRQA